MVSAPQPHVVNHYIVRINADHALGRHLLAFSLWRCGAAHTRKYIVNKSMGLVRRVAV